MADVAIDEAGVRFVVKGLSEYVGDIDDANKATTGIATNAEGAATKSKIAWGKIGLAAGAGALAVGAAAIAIGKAALDIATDLDAAADSIAIKTGATGVALEGLQTSFDNVFSTVPSSAQEVADAIGTINQKLGLTGTPLEEVSTQVLNLSRITGTDLTANIDAVTGAFQRWQTPAEDMPGLLDELFRASQESGVPVADLALSLQANKDVLDGFGLTMPDSIGLIGSLGLAGVDADTAFGGLKLALKTMAKEGVEDPAAALQEYFDRIKNAKTDAEATGIATEIFGKQAVGMADAIRDGSFDVKQFTTDMLENKNTIDGTAASTDDWKEKLEILRNRIIVGISPALNEMFSGLTQLVEDLQPVLDDFSEWWDTEAWPAIQEFWQNARPVIEKVMEALQLLSEPLTLFFEAAVGMAEGVFKAIKGLVDLVVALVHGDWQKAWDSAVDVVVGVGEAIIGFYQPFLDGAKRLAEAVLEGWMSIPIVSDITQNIADVVAAVIGFADEMFGAGIELLQSVVEGMGLVDILGWIAGRGGEIAGAVADWASGMWERGYAILNALLDGLKSAWQAILNWISNLPSLDDLLPDLPWQEGMDLTIPVKLTFLPVIPDDWWEALDDKDEAERIALETARRFQELVSKYFEEFRRNIPRPDLDFLPQDRIPVKTDPNQPADDQFPWIPPDEQRKRDRQRPGGPLNKDKTKDKPSLTDISDPARFLELVMQAIATIEALAGADVAPVSRKKLLALASGLRSIIVEFGNAMKGIKPETAEAAALIATFLDPILDALNQAVETIDKIAGSTGVGPLRIHAVMSALRAITLEAQNALRGIDAKSLKPTAETAEVVSDLMRSLASAARAAWDLAQVGKGADGGTGGGGVGGGVGGGGTPGGTPWSEILAGIRGTIPIAGGRLPGAVGGVSYNVVANYTNPQSPSSIRLDLEELALLAVA